MEPNSSAGAVAAPVAAESVARLTALFRNQSKFHLGGKENWSISSELVDFLLKTLRPGQSTLETGAGFSTVIFAVFRCRHICICPDVGEMERIRSFCASNAISMDTVSFINEPSQIALPKLDMGELDLVLVDGGHGFPVPQIDWFYTSYALRIGGLSVIDDIELWSCHILSAFLKKETGWRSLGDIGHRTAVFEKTEPFDYKEFCDQPYVVGKSRMRSLILKVRRVLSLIGSGNLGELRHRIRKLSA
ncbi:MAG: class I SAM-dependent methyltransferase [Parvibaculaceae bacterium]|nr:class I SAM-dependent methyltransferase [Parvibaculaceae bacterium]